MRSLDTQRLGTRPGHAIALTCGAVVLVAAGALALRGAAGLRGSQLVEPTASAPAPVPEPTRAASAAPVFESDAGLERARRAGLDRAAQGDPTRALEQLVPVYQARPDDEVALAIAEASLAKRDYKTAQTVLGALQAPDAPSALYVRGLLHEQASKLDQALSLYERAIPGLAQPLAALESRARVLGWLERFEESRAAYGALASDERSGAALRMRARVKMAELTAWNKDFDGALAQLRELLAEDPKHGDAWLLQGQVLEWQGRYAEAKQSYSTLLSFDASHAEARLRLDKLLWVH